MKASEVKVNGRYIAKVSGKLVEVRLDEEHPNGGWKATNMATGKSVRIKSARRLRGPAREKKSQDARRKASSKTGRTVVHVATPAKEAGKRDAAKAKKTPAEKKTTVKKKAPAKKRGMSGLAAAAKLLAETGRPMSAREITDEVIERGWWTPKGKTPAATLYSAIFLELKKKGEKARFRRAEERGKFALNA